MALRELRLRVPRSLIIEVVALPLPLRGAVEGARYCEICFQIGLVSLILGLGSVQDDVDRKRARGAPLASCTLPMVAARPTLRLVVVLAPRRVIALERRPLAISPSQRR
jgi:hypothetical protein